MPSEPLIVFSAPCNAQLYGSSVVSAKSVRPAQVLFGSDAQLSVAVKVLEGAKAQCLFSPCPEIFSSDVSFEALRQAARARTRHVDGPIIHARFGPIGEARVLKNAANCLFVAEGKNRPVLTLGQNFLPEGRVVPDAFRTVMHYGSFDRHLCRAGGEPPAFQQLPPTFSTADITEVESGAGGVGRAADHAAGHIQLQIQTFEEFDPVKWAGAAFVAPSPHTVQILRRSLIESARTNGASRSPETAFIALPFDMADPASLIPEILRTYAMFSGFEELGIRLMLMPFNDIGRNAALSLLIAEVRELCHRGNRRSAMRERLFVARLQNSEDCEAFARTIPVAMVDGCSPEARWTTNRLRTLGVKIVDLVDPDEVGATNSGEAEDPAVHRIELDEERRVRVLDAHGERIYAAKGASKRAIVAAFEKAAHLVRRSVVMAPKPQAAGSSATVNRDGNALLHELGLR